jgi:hypothetical protein
MSPASYLTAPPRVAGWIVAPGRADSIAAMWGWIVLAAAVLALAAVGVSGWLLATRALRTWRAVRRLQDTTLTELERLGDAAAATGERAGRLAEDERLSRSLDDLERSRAELAVLQSAVQEVRDMVGRVTAVVPRK